METRFVFTVDVASEDRMCPLAMSLRIIRILSDIFTRSICQPTTESRAENQRNLRHPFLIITMSVPAETLALAGSSL